MSDKDSYPFILQNIVNKSEWEIINASVPGFGIDQMYLQYLKYIEDNRQPEIVVLSFQYDTNGHNIHSFRQYAKPNFSNRVPKTYNEASNIPHPRLFKPCLEGLYSYCLIKSVVKKIKVKSGDKNYINGTNISTKIFLNLEKDIKNKNSKLILLSIPRAQMLDGKGKYFEYGKRIENWFQNICFEGNLNCISFYNLVKDEEKASIKYYFRRGHFNRKGNERVAKIINNKILDLINSK